MAGFVGAGLSAWLAADAVRPDVQSESAAAEAFMSDVLWLAQAGGTDGPMLDPPPPPPPPGEGPDLLLGDTRPEGGPGGPFGRRGPGGRHAGPEAGPDDRPLSPDEQRKLAELIRRHFPRLHERLDRLRQSHPMAYQRMLQRVRRPLSEIMHAVKENPELADKLVEALRVEMELHELRQQYQEASSDGERERIRGQMREQLERRFDLRRERLKWEIQLMERRLEDMKKQLEDKGHDKERIIAEEMKDLTTGPPDEPPPRPHWGFRRHQPPSPGPDPGL